MLSGITGTAIGVLSGIAGTAMIESFSRYADLSRTQDWKAICALNGVPFDSFGTKKELRVLPDYLERGETVLALCSGMVTGGFQASGPNTGVNTWVVALTDQRFLFLDCALLSRSVDTRTIRHDKVQSVSASQGWVLGRIVIDLGARVVVVDNCVRQSVAAMADLANRVLRAGAAPARPAPDAMLDQLGRLASLRCTGARNESGFPLAKARLLAAA